MTPSQYSKKLSGWNKISYVSETAPAFTGAVLHLFRVANIPSERTEFCNLCNVKCCIV